MKKVLSLWFIITFTILFVGCGDNKPSKNKPCSFDSDCNTGQICVDNVCKPIIEGFCRDDKDCPSGNICIENNCVSGCRADADCPSGYICSKNNSCIKGSCNSDSDCDPGYRCIDNTCQSSNQPRISLDKNKIDFGSIRLGVSVTEDLTITNIGMGDLIIYSLELEDQNDTEVTSDAFSENNITIKTNESYTISLTYTPEPPPTELADNLLISSNDPEGLIRVPLVSSIKGNPKFTALKDPNDSQSNVNELDFGTLPVGATKTISFYVINLGSGNAFLEVDEVRTDPLSSTNFTVTTDSELPVYLNTFEGEIDQSTALKIDVTFSPSTEGTHQEKLIISSNDEDFPEYEVILLGEGVNTTYSLEGCPLDFGTVDVGDSAEGQISINAISSLGVEIQDVSLSSGSDVFSIDSIQPQPPVSLQESDKVDIGLSFRAQQEGDYQGTLTITTNDSNEPEATCDLYATAIIPPVLEVDQTSIDFGETAINTQSVKTLVISNTGGSDLHISSIDLTDLNTPFSIPDINNLTVAPGSQYTLNITFSPQSVGNYQNSLTIHSDDRINPDLEIGLSGRGAVFDASVNPGSIDFGQVILDTDYTEDVTITNTGSGTVYVDNIYLDQNSSNDFHLTGVPQDISTNPVNLSPNNIFTFSVNYNTHDFGDDTGTIIINTNSGNFQIPLSGSGTSCPETYYNINNDPSDGCEYYCNPQAPGQEVCDGEDNDCNGTIDLDSQGEPLTESCYSGPAGTEGVGECKAGTRVCINGSFGDCIGEVTPIQESCNNKDDDCDGQIDNGVTFTFYKDYDNDGYGDPDNSIEACAAPSGYVADNRDCDDKNNAINPGAQEICNNKDDDCDGSIDEGLLNTYYKDADGDGYGVDSDTKEACSKPAGYSTQKGDCDDSDLLIHPWAQEVCNGKDDNCDNNVDEGGVCPTYNYYCDRDSDGYYAENISGTCSSYNCVPQGCITTKGDDCNDNDAAINPGATETCNNKDDNCNGSVDEGVTTTYYRDSDGDGYGNPNSSIQACTNPGGYTTDNTDCNDSDASIHPYAQEVCNGKDDNCNNQTDEGGVCPLVSYYCDADSDNYISETISGTCSSYNCVPQGCSTTKGTDCDDSDATINPGAPEICNGQDENCNNQIDEGVLNTYYADLDSDGYGNPNDTIQACILPNGYVTNALDCNDQDSTINPSATEVCDGINNDCDSLTDEDVQDDYEPNDTSNDAPYFGCFCDTTGCSNCQDDIGVYWTPQNSTTIHNSTDIDWYYFYAQEESWSSTMYVDVTLSGIPTGANYDLYVVFKNADYCNILAGSGGWNGSDCECYSTNAGNADEWCEMDVDDAGGGNSSGLVYIKVYPSSGYRSCYDYNVSWRVSH